MKYIYVVNDNGGSNRILTKNELLNEFKCELEFYIQDQKNDTFKSLDTDLNIISLQATLDLVKLVLEKASDNIPTNVRNILHDFGYDVFKLSKGEN